jgi:hypothetical protein
MKSYYVPGYPFIDFIVKTSREASRVRLESLGSFFLELGPPSTQGFIIGIMLKSISRLCTYAIHNKISEGGRMVAIAAAADGGHRLLF